ncbi:MAG: DUF454 family protein, partial [Alphaproteobacteria bacterium]|nr:DUF454 family protein [Alphaproteobacteria bacterium]
MRRYHPAAYALTGEAKFGCAGFHRWLFHHPRFGHNARAWHETRAIPPRARLMAVSMMAASLAFVTLFV